MLHRHDVLQRHVSVTILVGHDRHADHLPAAPGAERAIPFDQCINQHPLLLGPESLRHVHPSLLGEVRKACPVRLERKQRPDSGRQSRPHRSAARRRQLRPSYQPKNTAQRTTRFSRFLILFVSGNSGGHHMPEFYCPVALLDVLPIHSPVRSPIHDPSFRST